MNSRQTFTHLRWLGILGVLAAGAAPASAAPAGLPADLDLVARSGANFLAIRVGELTKNEPLRALPADLQKGILEDVEHLAKDVGTPGSQIDRLTILVTEKPSFPLVMVRTSRPYDRDAIRKQFTPEVSEEALRGNAAPLGKKPALIRDGLSNSLLVVEAGEAVPWTKPEPIPFDMKKAPPKLGGVFKDGFSAVMADGSVMYIENSIDPDLLKLMINIQDRTLFDWDRVPVRVGGRGSRGGHKFAVPRPGEAPAPAEVPKVDREPPMAHRP